MNGYDISAPLRAALERMADGSAQRILNAMGQRQPDWFRIVNQADGDTAAVWLYDEIGWTGTTAGEFVDQLGQIDAAAIDVHINSIGGSVFDGIAIYNALRAHDATVTTRVDSAALSIASVIAQAGDRRIMLSGSQMMIHEAWGLTIGFAGDMRESAELLDRQTENIAGIYAERVGGSGKKSRFLSLMAGEHWMNADETVAEGLADEVVRPKAVKAQSSPGSERKEGTAEPEDRWADFVTSASGIHTR